MSDPSEPTPPPPATPTPAPIPYATPTHLSRLAYLDRPAHIPQSYEAIPGAHGPVVSCSHCGYTGPGREEQGGSMLILVLLILFTLIFGFIYYILCMRATLNCPKCGTKICNI